MRTGNLDGIINASIWQKVYDSGDLSSAQTSITISNLDGNTDEEYLLITRIINDYNGASYYYTRPNNDSGANYGYQMLYNSDATTAAAARGTGANTWGLGSNLSLGSMFLNKRIMYAKSGYLRTTIQKYANSISGTTITHSVIQGQVWNDTSNNITSLVIYADQTNGLGIGSRIILLRKTKAVTGQRTGLLNVQGQVKGTFQKIYKNTLSSAATSVTISSLDGNTDILYILQVRAINGYAGTTSCYLYFNNDQTAANYGYQSLYGTNTTAAAYRNTASHPWFMNMASGSRELVTAIMYAKSGKIRVLLSNNTRDVSGTTVGTAIQVAESWNNTADNITSIVIAADQTNGLGIGTVIELEAYRLQ
jgi:hypothetical protein